MKNVPKSQKIDFREKRIQMKKGVPIGTIETP
jgi:hypothetical protein